MKSGDMVTYRHSGPLGHVLGGCPGILRDKGQGFAVVAFAAMLEPCQLEDLAPARLWWRRGAGAWQGPFPAWPDARDHMAGAGVDSALLEAGALSPLGASVIIGGWRYRLAWAGDDPPRRYG